MYVFPSMLKITKVNQPTKAHQKVAEMVLLCNPRYHTMTDFAEGARIIARFQRTESRKSQSWTCTRWALCCNELLTVLMLAH